MMVGVARVAVSEILFRDRREDADAEESGLAAPAERDAKAPGGVGGIQDRTERSTFLGYAPEVSLAISRRGHEFHI